MATASRGFAKRAARPRQRLDPARRGAFDGLGKSQRHCIPFVRVADTASPPVLLALERLTPPIPKSPPMGRAEHLFACAGRPRANDHEAPFTGIRVGPVAR
jgi:hypothetical protein